MEKKCTICKEVKTINNFSRYYSGYKSGCKSCYSKIEKARRVSKGGGNHLDRSIETADTKICTKCKSLKLKTEFKHRNWCLECIKIQNRKYADEKGVIPKFVPIVTENSKQCCLCKEIKTLNEYSNSSRGKLGKSAYCKKCNSLLQVNKYTTKEERRSKTQNYRNNNREWWRFLHRANQFNRNKKIKLNSDKTVTKDFMIELYETEICYYCKNSIEINNRTCDHRQPINKGGIHGKSNLVMACITCNTSKRDMTEEEFFKYLNNKK